MFVSLVTMEKNVNTALNDIIAQIEQNASKVRIVKDVTYVVNVQGDTKVRFAPQARTILIAILKSEKAEIKTSEILELEDVKNIKTKQSPERIFAYYKKAIIEAGFLSAK